MKTPLDQLIEKGRELGGKSTGQFYVRGGHETDFVLHVTRAHSKLLEIISVAREALEKAECNFGYKGGCVSCPLDRKGFCDGCDAREALTKMQSLAEEALK